MFVHNVGQVLKVAHRQSTRQCVSVAVVADGAFFSVCCLWSVFWSWTGKVLLSLT